MSDRYLTTDEVAKLLKVGVSTIRRWVKENKIPAIKVSRAIRIPADFSTYMQR